MIRRMKNAVVAVLLILISGKASAMFEKVFQLVYGNKKSIIGGAAVFASGIGGAGLLCALKNRMPHKEFVPLKSGKIAALEKDVRDKLGLDDDAVLPKNPIDEVFNKGKRNGYNEGFKAGRKKEINDNDDLKKLSKLYKGEIPENWDNECLGDYSAIYLFLDGNHPGYAEGEEAKGWDVALDKMKKELDTFGITVAKQIFCDDTKSLPENGLLKTYLSTQLGLILNRHQTRENDIKLLIAKKLVKGHTGGAPSGDFAKWIDQKLEKNFIQIKEEKRSKKGFFGKKKGKK